MTEATSHICTNIDVPIMWRTCGLSVISAQRSGAIICTQGMERLCELLCMCGEGHISFRGRGSIWLLQLMDWSVFLAVPPTPDSSGGVS